MISRRIIRRTIQSWRSWRQRKAILRAYPDLAELDRKEREYRRSHRRGSASIQKAKRDLIASILSGRAA